MPIVTQLDHANLTVADLVATEAFYAELLGFERVEAGTRPDGTPWAILRAGGAMLCIYERDLDEVRDWTLRTRHGFNHLGFRITDADEFEARVERMGLSLRFDGAVRYPHSTSWYVVDPTGYELEIVAWDEDRIRFPAA